MKVNLTGCFVSCTSPLGAEVNERGDPLHTTLVRSQENNFLNQDGVIDEMKCGRWSPPIACPRLKRCT